MKFSDELLRKLAIGSGILSGLFFIASLIALIEIPSLFKYLALAMILMALIFLVFRSAYNYRNTFKVKDKRR